MPKIARVVGCVWAAPLTLLGLVYVSLFALAGWYKRCGLFDAAVVWQVNVDRAPSWLNRLWARWGGHTVGQVVVLKYDPTSERGKLTLRHEQEHVHQCMVMGIAQPIAYFLIWLVIHLCRSAHPYWDHPLEIDARRAAGQVVDVIGALKRAAAEGRIKLKR